MTAPIVTPFRNPVRAERLEEHAAGARDHLERPLRHARYGPAGQLWERIAEAADLAARTCPECKDSVPHGWTLEDHFNCNYPEDFENWIPGDCPVHGASCEGQHP